MTGTIRNYTGEERSADMSFAVAGTCPLCGHVVLFDDNWVQCPSCGRAVHKHCSTTADGRVTAFDFDGECAGCRTDHANHDTD